MMTNLSKQEINYLLERLGQTSDANTEVLPQVFSSQINYGAVRIQLDALADLSVEYRQKFELWIEEFKEQSADRIVIADLGPNETAVMISGMIAALAAIHALTMKRITIEDNKSTEEYYSLPAELGKMFKSIPVGLVEAVQKIIDSWNGPKS